MLKQILDAFAGAGARARIVTVHGSPEARKDLMTTLQAFADEHPQCAPELRQLARESG